MTTVTLCAQWTTGSTTISTNQNVGIGTSNTSYKLDIAGDTKSQNIIMPRGYFLLSKLNDNFTYQDNAVGHYSIGWNVDSWNTGGSTLWQSSYAGIKFFTAGVYRLGINQSGNVGIGTESPAYKLDVVGSVAANSLYLRPEKVVDGWRQTVLEYDGHDLIIGSVAGVNAHNHLVIRPGGAGKDQLRSVINLYSTTKDNEYQNKVSISTEGKSFFNGGNVGIGTDNPQNKLDVVGTIRATEVKVETGWADFVFAPDYNLRSLDEVKAHIEEHKHLPDIPSEKEVKENGVSLGEMQAKLLQKIEELTLYVIELKEESKEIKDENEKMKKENKEIKQQLKTIQNL